MMKLIILAFCFSHFLLNAQERPKQKLNIYYPQIKETTDLDIKKKDTLVEFSVLVGKTEILFHTLKSCLFEDSSLIIIHSFEIYPDSLVSIGGKNYVVQNVVPNYRTDTVYIDNSITVYDGVTELENLFVYDKKRKVCVLFNLELFTPYWEQKRKG